MRTTTHDAFVALPYTIEVRPNEDGLFARIEALPGCMTWTDRIEDIWPMIEDAKRAWIADALDAGDPIPVPAEDDGDAQRVPVRMPRQLHRHLINRASGAGVSVDELVVAELARAVGE